MSAAGRDDDWDDYRFVLALHRAGSLAAAERELGVDGTTVARRLTQVETRLGARLSGSRARTAASASRGPGGSRRARRPRARPRG